MLLLVFWGFALNGWVAFSQEEAEEAQQSPPEAQAQPVEGEPDDAPITGGVSYSPQKDPEEESLRDPFKSPFDLAKEEEERRRREAQAAPLQEGRLEYLIQELNLKGIFLEARTGYWAIFEVGGVYKWFQVGERFQDGDLVNITDNEVLFKQYIDDESQNVPHREIVVELHRRGEE